MAEIDSEAYSALHASDDDDDREVASGLPTAKDPEDAGEGIGRKMMKKVHSPINGFILCWSQVETGAFEGLVDSRHIYFTFITLLLCRNTSSIFKNKPQITPPHLNLCY